MLDLSPSIKFARDRLPNRYMPESAPLAILATSVMILPPSVALSDLSACVQAMAREQEIVLRGDGQGVPHKRKGIDCKSARHRTGNQVGTLPSIKNCRDWDAKVGRWAPEMGRTEIIQGPIRPDLLVQGSDRCGYSRHGWIVARRMRL